MTSATLVQPPAAAKVLLATPSMGEEGISVLSGSDGKGEFIVVLDVEQPNETEFVVPAVLRSLADLAPDVTRLRLAARQQTR